MKNPGIGNYDNKPTGQTEVEKLRAALGVAEREVERLTTQLALRDQACELGGAEVRYERARADAAVQALTRVKAAHSKLHGRCDNPICPLRAALVPVSEQPKPKENDHA